MTIKLKNKTLTFNASQKMKDFSICDSKVHGVEGLINIQGIESPGVTSSLAIGEYVKNMINRILCLLCT